MMGRVQEINRIPAVPARRPDAHKGDFGRALIVGGSVGLAGAPILAAAAALRSGAGLVELAVPWSVYIPAATRLPDALVTPLEETPDGKACPQDADAARLARRADAAAIGPGLSTGDGPARTLAAFALAFSDAAIPAVYDADALNIFASNPQGLPRAGKRAILTPHPGEMARLTGLSREDVQADRRGVAAAFARQHGVIVVLKGAGTVVTDGGRLFVNTTGSHGLARGGSGDVLAGMLAALLAQKMDPFDAAVLAVNAHGRAGDAAQKAQGAMGMTVEDVIQALPAVWRLPG